MATLRWYEGQVTFIEEPDLGSMTRTCTAWVSSEGFAISNIQLPLVVAHQTKVNKGDKIVFYRDSSASARYAFSISDPTPIGGLSGTVSQPISIETAGLALQTGEDSFQSGEWAASAQGDSSGAIPLSGSFIWLKNNGDGFLCSGTYANRIEVSDSTDSVDIQGTNVDIYAQGNLIYTQEINIDQDVLGNITLEMGQCNPTTGVFLSSFSCKPDGSWSLFHLPTLSGISFNPIPSLPATLETPQIQLTSNPLTSQLTVNQLGTTIFALLPATIDLIGTTTFSGPTIFTEPAIFEEISFTLENPLVPPTGTVPVVIAVPAVILDVPVVIEGTAAGPADGYLAATLAGVPIQIPYYLA